MCKQESIVERGTIIRFLRYSDDKVGIPLIGTKNESVISQKDPPTSSFVKNNSKNKNYTSFAHIENEILMTNTLKSKHDLKSNDEKPPKRKRNRTTTVT
mmetsp:Transcript_62417/g.92718  ORF Transcript_62417/g.92718 Transcript_62417/m.92718 type:complete len:99 (-) Transcript_62417:1350-1646(-)